MNDDMKTGVIIAALSPLLAILLLIITLPIGLYNAFVVSQMYHWFVVPLGAPSLNIWWIWGLILTLGLIKGTKIDKAKDERTDTQKFLEIFIELIAMTLVLLVGLVLKGHIH